MSKPPVRVIQIGPVVLGLRRRQQPLQEWVELDEAVSKLAAAMRATSEVRWLERALRWLVRLGA